MDTIELEIEACRRLGDEELWALVPRLARTEREDLARFLIHLNELARRELHLMHAYSGLFRYLVTLGFSEWEARARALACVAGGKYRSIFTLLRSGQLNLTALTLVAPYLTSENHESLLGKACRRSTREVQALVAQLDPQAPRRDVVRVVSIDAPCAQPQPEAASRAADADPAWSGEFFPTTRALQLPAAAPAVGLRLRYAFDAAQAFDERLRRARELLRHKYPFGEMEHVLFDALEALLDRIDPERRLQRRQLRARRKKPQ